MIVRKSIRWGDVARHDWPQFLFMVVYSAAVVLIYRLGYEFVAIPSVMASMLGIGISVLLAFRTNAAYDRWWEARRIWGGIVNASRTFARQVLSLFAAGDEQARMMQKELVHRQIAWVYALNYSLRWLDPLPHLEPFLAREEINALRSQANRPNAIIQTQGERLSDARVAGHLDTFLSLPIETTLADLTDRMGECERIKNTPFPTPYGAMISRIIWIFFLLLPTGLVKHLGWVTVPVSITVSLVFLLIDTLGDYMQDPFENSSTDIPMTALCRTIEINLKQQLGETDLPAKLEPEDGVLM